MPTQTVRSIHAQKSIETVIHPTAQPLSPSLRNVPAPEYPLQLQLQPPHKMVLQVSKLLLSLALAALTVQAEQAPAFDVPSFDYATLTSGNTPSLVLDALKKDGIITLKNIPAYAATRELYLAEAAACAVAAKDANAQFLLHKELSGGVKRYTISTSSGQDVDTTTLAATEATCPGYAQIYGAFTGILERAVASLADTLDATTFTTQDGYANAISTRKLFGEAVRLDHFHAYEAPQTVAGRQLSATDDLSLPLHEDDGMFIVFPTPAFYKVKSDKSLEAVAAGASAADSGLVIETHDHKRVRPVLKADEVTVMVGTGFNKWVKTSDRLPAVTHGMQMPTVVSTPLAAKERLLRSWFGKMTLLPSYHRMLSHMTFEQHANATARFLRQDAAVDAMTIGCAPGRKLVASATPECSFKDCSTKAGAAAPSEGCSVVCNRNHDGDDALCASSCSCAVSAHRATTCWMLCVKDLDTCVTNDQVCSGQSLVCKATPAPTPAPTTQTPATPAPTTKTPTAPAPTTQPPATPGTTPSPTTGSPSTPGTTPSPTTGSPSSPGTTPSPTTGTPTSPGTPSTEAPTTPASTVRPGC